MVKLLATQIAGPLAEMIVAFVLAVATLSAAEGRSSVNLTKTGALSCPPGFVSRGNSCVCANWPNEIIACDENLQTASMQFGYCMTYVNETGELRAGACPQGLLRSNFNKFYYPLPSNAADLNDAVCGPLNSKGILCSECRDGFGPSALSFSSCVKCTNSGWLKYLAIEYLLNAFFLFAIVILGVNVISGPVNAFIYFSQTSTAYVNVAFTENVLKQQGAVMYSVKPVQVISSFYDIWNFKFFHKIIPDFCLTERISHLEGFSLQYIIAVFPLFLVVVLYVCIELHARNFRPLVWCWKPFHKCFVYCRRNIHPETSVIDAFATVTLLSYVKSLNITNFLLLFGYLYNGSGEKINTVALYRADIEFFRGKHLAFALPAILVFFTFIVIPPAVLILYKYSFFQRFLTRCRLNTLALRTFVEKFQGPYKHGANGTVDHRYFAGLYFILRILVFFISFGGFIIFFLGSSILYIYTALFFALLQPYRKHIHNIVDSIIFAILSTVYILLIVHAALISFRGEPSTFLFVLTDLVYSLPLLYLIVYIVFWLVDRRTGCAQKLKRYQLLKSFFRDHTDAETRTNASDDSDVPHRLDHPTDYTEYAVHAVVLPRSHNTETSTVM